MSDEDKFLTTQQVADRLGLHRKTVQKMCTARKITCYSIGNGWKIREKDLDAWINTRRQNAVNPTDRRYAA